VLDRLHAAGMDLAQAAHLDRRGICSSRGRSHRPRLVRQCYDEPRAKDVTVDEQRWQAEQFERHRAHLQAVAYRMLGSVPEAEDAVQEAWLRLQRADGDAVVNVGGWLTTVVGRVCLDMLRSRRSRREDYVPEPVVVVEAEDDPEQQALLADSVGLALLVVLETLTPAERLAFVLHDMFDVPFEEIAPVVDRTPAAARQLASRARRRIRGPVLAAETDRARQREVVDAFLAASRGGDFEALMRILDPDVVFRTDLRPPVVGAGAVVEQVLARGARFAPEARPAIVNGAAGVVVGAPGRVRAIVGFVVVEGRIAEIDLVLDPERVRAAVS
jgi:RNA polymerase sigma-70 factor (ECF subfamily)